MFAVESAGALPWWVWLLGVTLVALIAALPGLVSSSRTRRQLRTNGAADPTTSSPGEGTAGDALSRIEARQIEDQKRTQAALSRIGEELRLSIQRDDQRFATHSDRIHGAEDGLRRVADRLDGHIDHPPRKDPEE